MEYVPFVVLVFVFLSIRLDRASIRNCVSVTVGAFTVWILSPAQSQWGKVVAIFLLVLAVVMSPLRLLLINVVTHVELKNARLLPWEPLFASSRNLDTHQEETLTNPALINVLSDPLNAKVDIVAVHGLGSSVETTWTHKRSGRLWLKDFLPLDIPDARIMTFRHHSEWKSQALAKDLTDHGKQLLNALEGARSDESKDRPFIFVGHSFGGLLIQQALVLAKRNTVDADLDTKKRYKRLTDCFAGAIFLGTPHGGSNYSVLGKLYCFLHYWDGANPLLLGYMDPGSREVIDLENDFLKYFHHLSIDYYERKPNFILGMQFKMVVTREAGTRPGQDSIPLDTDHFGLNKYQSRDDASYTAVKNQMSQMVECWTNKMEKKRFRVKVQLNDFHRWVSNLDPSDRHEALCHQRHVDTGFWLLQTESFQKWISPRETLQVLWIHGIMGSGKSIQASRVIDKVREYCDTSTGEHLAFAYFYFDFNNDDYRDPIKMLRSLLVQVGTMNPKVEKSLKQRLAVPWGEKRQPSIELIYSCLRELVQKFGTSYIVLDALDECKDWYELHRMITRILSWGKTLKVLLISRKERDIEEDLDFLQAEKCSISLQGDGVDNDMRTYIQSMWNMELRAWARRLEKRPKRRMEIEEELVTKADGMFRWLELQLIDLRSFCDTNDGKGLEEKLNSLPRGLDATYFRILDRTTDHEKSLRLLQWLSFSARPMTVREVAQALAIRIDENGKATFDLGAIPSPPQDILKLCPGMFNTVVTAGSRHSQDEVAEDDEIRLAHFSVKEYLQSDTIRRTLEKFYIQKIPTNIYQARACLAFMMWVQKSNCIRPITEEAAGEYPFGTYSAQYWPTHTRISIESTKELEEESSLGHIGLGNMNFQATKLTQEVEQLLNSKPSLLTWISLFDPDLEKPRFGATDADVLSPLYYASLCGFSHHVRDFLDKGADVEVQGGCVGRPLRAACRHGFLSTVTLLIDKGAVFPKDRDEDDKVFEDAAISGNSELVQFLLAKEREKVPGSISHVNAMFEAVARGFLDILLLLVNSENVNINVPQIWPKGGRLLEKAAQGGQATMARHLLELGAEVNFQGGWYGTAIRAAALEGHKTVVQELLKHGANPHLSGNSPGSAMVAAIAFERSSVIDTLLQYDGLDVNNDEGMCGSQLQEAASIGNLELVRELVRRGGNVNATGGEYHTALQAACAEGHPMIVDLLLENGATPDVSDDGRSEIIECLTGPGEFRPNIWWLPWKKSANQQYDPVPTKKLTKLRFPKSVTDEDERRLRTLPSQITFQKSRDGTALRSAVIRGDIYMVRRLLEHKASTEARGGAIGSVLGLARRVGNEEIELLLEKAGAKTLEGEDFEDGAIDEN